MLELKEFLFAANQAKSGRTVEDRTLNVRTILWMHRFDVMTWLQHNGVSIPMNLLSDAVHAQPGSQSVDAPVEGESEPEDEPGKPIPAGKPLPEN